MAQQGYIHILMGDGAGKTTAAFGSVLRFCAYGRRALVIQFLKCLPSGECLSLQSVSGADVLVTGRCQKFYPDMTKDEKEDESLAVKNALELAKKKMLSGEYQMIVLDEIGGVIENKMVSEMDVLSILELKPQETELILTGRVFPTQFQAKADYISKICSVKHPYTRGVTARKGIEF